MDMINISDWMNVFLQKLNDTFGSRVWFVGLQGSYGRGEATKTSDIDVVVIFDELSALDIKTYHDMLDTLSHREWICGFISGKNELINWEPSDLFQLYYDTTPVKGTLDAILPLLDSVAVDRAIKIGACNIYHGCVHNMLHEKSADILKGLYKFASFVIQAIAFRQTGKYFRRQVELMDVVSNEEKTIIETFLKLKKGGEIEFQAASEGLFAWCAERIKN